MKIAYIGTYAPRRCGIGTFTGNKFSAVNKLGNGKKHDGFVVAMTDEGQSYDYPPEVRYVINQNNPQDYLRAADYINKSGADICIVEHEFGIFGGADGSYLLPLLHRLDIPFMAVLHTVLKTPSPTQKLITNEIVALSASTVVMSEKAVEFLTTVYGLAADKISIIDHGIPDFDFDHNRMKKALGFEGKKLLLTFGLISRNKGIETVLRALPAVVKQHPEVIYMVLGKTHPAVVRHSGEEYRDFLKTICRDLEIENNVMFVEEFVDEKKLFKYLSAADIYITPYLNEAQITSGTLSYAVGAGCAVISTPYWHAAELLTEDRGRLFESKNSDALVAILNELCGDKILLSKLRRNARAYGKEVTWIKTAERYVSLSEKILSKSAWQISKKEKVSELEDLPALALDHIKRMTDGTGLLQHAKFGIPNLKEGYCLDDNARALLMVLMGYRSQKHLPSLELLPVYLSYIHYMQNEDGTFRNFLSFSRNFLDEVGSEDSFGRTIWALGYLTQHAPAPANARYGKDLFLKAAPNFEKLKYVRGVANAMIGISHYLQANENDAEMRRVLRALAEKLLAEYETNSCDKWKWFESVLTYDNAVLPLAMLHAGDILKDDKILSVGFTSMDFLLNITLRNGSLSVIGNEKWFAKNGEQSAFAQQPIDAMMSVLMLQKAYQITGDDIYRAQMQESFMWFLGKNDLRLHLYDHETKGCFDGLECYGVNRNMGAESTLAYVISLLAMYETRDAMSNGKEIAKSNNLQIERAGIAV